ncbi:lipid IV(A) 3-deoxy-D-manno-octulosonic acid transferase [Methyloversatilis sp.]|uniref:lipid IV(A) 3-deoxy-D-manno-octulosonic acid transferase n=1 Tax=Methyloversatilis sp. TaxID=2569862 RepID=UPI00273331D3|nr:lipid IV(A) 3-deoxy-D-manno-octulosonic acid transferase [Methyloversatilis sp.]MDP2795506.1 lipid IV(A) 3-deoxy-D-manno-octulosonic acid transferase [Sulfurisoma sp.]MDP3457139.1 lipid IV(A) 3-deoxy-D-manno-octulosonic acid transferase [Methyloversatilis sp.]MDP3576774.1 lipid IV(A) 3-deoxy-D-manno-octulosonic acid transferase [Methyloversatilis sp.]
MRFLYSTLWILVLPLALLRLFWRSRSEAGYARNIMQRLGFFRAVTLRSTIWLHAVSVGETRAAQTLIDALRARWPDARILLTQTTATGRATAQSLYGDAVTLAWLPWDLPWSQRAFLRVWRPAIGILLETELWPNLIAECRRAGVPVVLANARLSERSAHRYARLPSLVGAMLQSLSGVAAQTEADAGRLRALGARAVTVAGNLKFDLSPPPDQLALGERWRAALGRRRIVLLASTRDGEETLLLTALEACLPDDVLIALVPRHPQRFDAVARLVAGRGLTLARRSAGTLPGDNDRVWLGDSMGEMFAWYALADLAVIGGSWLPLGGQNLIEACAAGCPVIIGPHTFNFAQATEDALAAGAALRAADVDEMAATTCRLLADPASLKTMSDEGRAFAASHRGATGRCMALIRPLLQPRLDRLADGDRPPCAPVI